MKALVVRQPWASLIALGVKTIETRPAPPNGPMRPDGVRGLPGCSLRRGERIAIVAGASAPQFRPDVDNESDDGTGWWVGDTFFRIADGRPTDDGWWIEQWPDSTDDMRTWPLPLGAVACTAVVADAMPIIDATGMRPGDGTEHVPDGLYRTTPSTLWLLDNGAPWDAGAELPFGDFAPGRWGWLLTDVEPCVPLPVKGRQGVFELPEGIEL